MFRRVLCSGASVGRAVGCRRLPGRRRATVSMASWPCLTSPACRSSTSRRRTPNQRASFALIPDEREWRLFLTQLKTSGVPLDPSRYYSSTSPVSIRIWALPSGHTPQDVLALNPSVPPGVEVVDLLTDDELGPSTPDQHADDILSDGEPDPVEPEDGEAFEPGPIDPSVVEAVLHDMCEFFGIDPSDAVRPGFTHTPLGMKTGLPPPPALVLFLGIR